MSQRDYSKKVRGEKSLLEKIMGYAPGYRGYKEKELRRESDRLVRTEAVNRLKAAKTAFRRTFANPSLVQKLAGEDTYRYEALTSRVDRVTQRIDRAIAGYAGMFDAVKVKEDKLDSSIDHDLSLIESAESINVAVGNISRFVVGTEEWRMAMDTLLSKIDDLDKLIDERTNILKGLQA